MPPFWSEGRFSVSLRVMSFVSRRICRHSFIALWLVLYAAAGMIVHTHLGHKHEPNPAANSLADHNHHHGHSHSEHAEGEHNHHNHSHADDHEHSAGHLLAEALGRILPATEDTHHHHPGQEDCAGCQLLGSVSAPVSILELVECGRLHSPVLLIEESFSSLPLVGVRLGRAPPAA